jgi:peptidoglycan/xylan/chitin deacetylase (PgdA/CDA1 family)
MESHGLGDLTVTGVREMGRTESSTLVLCYHALSYDWPAVLAVEPGEFEAQLEQLVERGYVGATFTDAVRGDAPERALAVTFDDAFRSVLDHALPILDRLGLPATVFVSTDYPGSGRPMAWDGLDRWLGGPHESELDCLSWPELRSLQDRGWEIGSHTRSHPRLTELDDGAVMRELAGSRDRCAQEMGAPCTSLAYPYGACDERVIGIASAAGYEGAGGLDARFRRFHRLRWPRIGVYRTDAAWRFELKVSPVVRTLRSSPAWEALRVAQRAGRFARRPTPAQR